MRWEHATPTVRLALSVGIAVVAAAGLWELGHHNYLLFRCLAELFSIAVAAAVFAVAWNARRVMDNGYLLFLGIALAFVAGIDLLHTLTYKGMQVLPNDGTDVPTQLWIAARGLQAVSFLAAPLFFRRSVRPTLTVATFAVLSTGLVLSILHWRVFPVCHAGEAGLTPFKVYAEYAISAALLAALAALLQNRARFSPAVLRLVCASLALTILAELAFTQYVSVYGGANVLGHLLKVLAFFLLYKAIVETGLRRPYELLYRDVRASEERFHLLADAVPQLVFTVGPDGQVDYVNQRWREYLGPQAERARHGALPDLVHPDDRDGVVSAWQKAVQTHGPLEVRCRLRHADGSYRWFLARAVPAQNSNGDVTRWFGTCTDIDDQHQAHEEIAALNARLQRAMAETHHRVKNNLQVVAALVDMQVMQDREETPTAELARLGHHIRGLAAVHDLLTQEAREDAAVTHVSARDALRKLQPLLEALVGGREIRFLVEDVQVPVRQGTSLAVLVNELVSNAVKHGSGPIDLSLTRSGECARLAVSDRGTGFPEGFDPTTAANTGLELIQSLGQWDLRGEVTFANLPEGGAQVVVTFPIAE